jgi:hypothetical protein
MSKRKSNNSRRDFIKNASLAVGGFYILPRHVLGGKGFIAPSDKLQIAGIGAGGKGESDLYNFYQSGKADIAFLCDVDERQSAKSRERYPKAKVYKDYREMLDKEHKNFCGLENLTITDSILLTSNVSVLKPILDPFDSRKLNNLVSSATKGLADSS